MWLSRLSRVPAGAPVSSAAEELPTAVSTRPPKVAPGRQPSALRRRLAWLITVVAAAFVLAYLLRNVLLGTPVPVQIVSRQDLLRTVVATARVASPARVAIGAEISGRIIETPVDVGDTVRAGQLLVVLDDDSYRASLEQARARVGQAELHLQKLRDVDRPIAQQTVGQARADAELAQRHLKRGLELHEKGFIGQADLEELRHARTTSDNTLRLAQLQLAARAAGGSEEQLLRMSLQESRAGLAAAEAGARHTQLRAPADAILIGRDAEVGDVVQPGRTLMTLSVTGETELIAQIDEKSLGLLRIGQLAVVSADAYPDQRFAASVIRLDPAIDSTRGTVEVRLKVAQPPDYLRQDMTVSVDIEVDRRLGALVVPAEVVRRDGESDWVMVLDGGHAQRRLVRVGMPGQGWVEIIDGLAQGELVIPPSADHAISPGQRVRRAS